jgi:AcrR family transcriptional regulator
MKKVNTTTGRIDQKAKTKSRILDETKKLLQKDTSITLEDVALKSNISRATIYRYYSNVDLLIMEASLEISHKSPDEFYEEVKEKTLEEGILYIQEQYNNFAQQNEIVFRRYLSAVLSESISSKEKLRGARRVKTMNKVLKLFENEIDIDNFTKLKNTASILMGIDALIVCKDVCDLDNQEANETLKWALKMILKGINS